MIFACIFTLSIPCRLDSRNTEMYLANKYDSSPDFVFFFVRHPPPRINIAVVHLQVLFIVLEFGCTLCSFLSMRLCAKTSHR